MGWVIFGAPIKRNCLRAQAVDSALGMPILDSVCSVWRWRFDRSTMSWSMIPMRPTHAHNVVASA